MQYEINVARPANQRITFTRQKTNYVHYFKVGVEYGKVKEVYEQLCKAFPDCKIEVTRWKTVGHNVDMEKFNH